MQQPTLAEIFDTIK